MVYYKIDKIDAVEKQLQVLKKEVLGKKSFVLFVRSSSCYFCVKMKPEWEKLRRRASRKYGDLPIIEVDSEAMYEMTKKHPDNDLSTLLRQVITSYPTIAFVEQKMRPKKLVVHMFHEERTADKLDDFIHEYHKSK